VPLRDEQGLKAAMREWLSGPVLYKAEAPSLCCECVQDLVRPFWWAV
jgi:hypothetical protein